MLFQRGNFTLNSGQHSDFKIDCDALTDDDLNTIAYLLAQRLSPFGAVIGIPRGGVALAEMLLAYRTSGPTLIVDDVLTTGGSMEAARHDIGTNCIGAVIFARKECPAWITPLFNMTTVADANN